MSICSEIQPNLKWVKIISRFHDVVYLDPHKKIFFFKKSHTIPNLENCEEFISYVKNVFTLVCNVEPDDFVYNTNEEIQIIYDCAYDTIIPQKYVFMHAQLCGCNIGHCNAPLHYGFNEYVDHSNNQCCSLEEKTDNKEEKITKFSHLFEIWAEKKCETNILKQGFCYHIDYQYDIACCKIDPSEQLYKYSSYPHENKDRYILPFVNNREYILWSYV